MFFLHSRSWWSSKIRFYRYMYVLSCPTTKTLKLNFWSHNSAILRGPPLARSTYHKSCTRISLFPGFLSILSFSSFSLARPLSLSLSLSLALSNPKWEKEEYWGKPKGNRASDARSVLSFFLCFFSVLFQIDIQLFDYLHVLNKILLLFLSELSLLDIFKRQSQFVFCVSSNVTSRRSLWSPKSLAFVFIVCRYSWEVAVPFLPPQSSRHASCLSSQLLFWRGASEGEEVGSLGR